MPIVCQRLTQYEKSGPGFVPWRATALCGSDAKENLALQYRLGLSKGRKFWHLQSTKSLYHDQWKDATGFTYQRPIADTPGSFLPAFSSAIEGANTALEPLSSQKPALAIKPTSCYNGWHAVQILRMQP
jgi:hypothetical protein